jgi:N-succinyldiaminopimelate aminotransferase
VHQRRFYGLDYEPDSEVTVFVGASEAIAVTFQALCDPGDEVILLEPCFDVYQPCLAMAGAVARVAALEPPQFTLNYDAIERLVSPKTRAIVLNDPHNPTGRVFAIEDQTFIAELCRSHDLLAICDQVYEHIIFGQQFMPLATLPGMQERSILISSTGKTFSLTGWKIGFACAPAPISAAMRVVHKFITLCASTPLQYAMAEALGAGDEVYREIRIAYQERRDFLCEALAGLGFGVEVPAGTPFLLADVRPLGYQSGHSFCLELPKVAGVAARPLTPFYSQPGESCSWVRFAFCKKLETLATAVSRLRSTRLAGPETTRGLKCRT